MTTPIAILGATGAVGQKLIRMIEGNSGFHVAEVAASERRQGKTYGEVVSWKEEIPLPESVRHLPLCSPQKIRSPFALSALPGKVAQTVEPELARMGIHVVSNASSLRMGPTIPLLIPEVNREHLSLIHQQTTPGKIVTNPNCATVFVVLALAPLLELGELEHLSVVTLQAISGAGHHGLSALDIVGNIIPNIPGEEEKIEEETKKILGHTNTPAPFSVTAHVHRVPVLHGHTIALHLFFKTPVTIGAVQTQYAKWTKRFPSLYQIYQDDFHPQPLKNIHSLDQKVHIGRIKQGDRPHIVGLISLGHNLVRGAAGAALLNLEALKMYLQQHHQSKKG